ncbi:MULTISPECIES: ferritin-like domain-containing protein [unclassified Streptomyces]|uniref:ferritin-like domain-containing protein n=1 Tax=unclassified Streptomyces TaxID=2593676 RepID=UPI002E331FD1|nr:MULTISPECIES: ferritin-like domain-containing protein [unclassified Streptomyces]WUC63612.1 ferritin-like domain-containing protein [Streptomyces sp. NBC_00539]
MSAPPPRSGAEAGRWAVPAGGAASFTWEYGGGREQMLALYQRGKDRQWDAMRRIDWDHAVDPADPLGTPDEVLPLHGTSYWDRLSTADRSELRMHYAAWQFSQFLHGEQGAMICSSRIVQSAPDLDAKFYAATQTMDEARHVEIFSRFLSEKLAMHYPINDSLRVLLNNTLTDSRWDMPYLGMQVLIEGLALAAFGLLRDTTNKPLPRQLLAYVMQDEARHVAFGRMALRDHYRQLSASELADREEFVIEGCHLMHDRLRGTEVLENFGVPAAKAARIIEESSYLRLFRRTLFSRIMPCVKDIGLWSPEVQDTFTDLCDGDPQNAVLDRLMRQDEEVAERLDAERFAAEEQARAQEVTEMMTLGREP